MRVLAPQTPATLAITHCDERSVNNRASRVAQRMANVTKPLQERLIKWNGNTHF